MTYRTSGDKKVTAEQKASLKKEFDEMDTDKSGVIEFEEIITFSVDNTKFDLMKNRSIALMTGKSQSMKNTVSRFREDKISKKITA